MSHTVVPAFCNDTLGDAGDVDVDGGGHGDGVAKAPKAQAKGRARGRGRGRKGRGSGPAKSDRPGIRRLLLEDPDAETYTARLGRWNADALDAVCDTGFSATLKF
jgi:hypothetical protein